MKKHYRHENNCLNCGTTLTGKFCHNCGQENLEIKESFGHMITHAVSDYFHFDHQFFHTLQPLLFKPGKLTNEYMAGRRVQYLHPVKMYIFISLVFFIVFFKEKGHAVKSNHKKIAHTAAADTTHKAPKPAEKTNDDENAVIGRGKIFDFSSGGPSTKEENDRDVALFLSSKYPSYQAYLEAQEKLPENQRDNAFERYFRKKKFEYKENGGDPREIISDAVKHNFPKMMFILLPLYALILKLAFWRNRKFYVEHLIFSFHLHCFIFLFFTFVIFLNMIIPPSWGLREWINFAVGIVIMLYVYKALKAVYHRSRFRTITKMLGSYIAYSVVFGLCLLILFVVSAVTAV
jgi:hypothetical protein